MSPRPNAPAPIFAGAPLWFDLRALADPTGRRIDRIARAMLLYDEPHGDPTTPSPLAVGLITRYGIMARHGDVTMDDPQLAESLHMLCIYTRRLEDVARQLAALLAEQRPLSPPE